MKNKFAAIAAIAAALGGLVPNFGIRQSNHRAPTPAKKQTQHDRDMLAKAQAKRDRKAGRP